MPPNGGDSTWGGIWENPSYDAACDEVAQRLGIDRRRLDDITSGLTWALGQNPLQFTSLGGNSYGAMIRGAGQHPDLIVVYTYDIILNETTLEWIG